LCYNMLEKLLRRESNIAVLCSISYGISISLAVYAWVLIITNTQMDHATPSALQQ